MGHLFTTGSDKALALATEPANLHGRSLDAVVTQASRQRMRFEQVRETWIAQVRTKVSECRATLRKPPPLSGHRFLYDEETGLPI